MTVISGVVHAKEGFQGQKWDILGQTYIPLHVTESSFALQAIFPPDSIVPKHVHHTQDEFLHVLEGTLTVELGDEEIEAGPGTHLTMPMNTPHALYNRTDKDVIALVVDSPTHSFYEYMQMISGMTDREEMARLAAEHNVPFV